MIKATSVLEEQTYSLLCSLMLLLTLSGCVLGLFPFSPNRLIIPVIVILLISLIAVSMVNALEVYILFSLAFTSLTSFTATTNYSANLDDLLYFLVGTLWLLFIANDGRRALLKAAIHRQQRLFTVFTVLLVVFLAKMLVLPSCYSVGWGGETYFVGFCGINHTMASCICVIETLLVMQTLQQKKQLFILIGFAVCIYATLATGARTFIIPSIVCLYIYIRLIITQKTYRWLLYLVGGIGVVVLLIHSAVGNKFSFLMSGNAYGYTRFIDGFTTGRTVIWATDLREYFRGDALQFLFGRGFDAIYQINIQNGLGNLWAHNDFINLLVCGGVYALLSYVITFGYLLRSTFYYYSLSIKNAILLFAIFPAVINGLYMYQNYIISFVFFYCFVDELEMNASCLNMNPDYERGKEDVK